MALFSIKIWRNFQLVTTNKKHPSGRLVYWLAKYGDVYSTHTCNSYIHCQSATMPNRNGTVKLDPLKKKE